MLLLTLVCSSTGSSVTAYSSTAHQLCTSGHFCGMHTHPTLRGQYEIIVSTVGYKIYINVDDASTQINTFESEIYSHVLLTRYHHTHNTVYFHIHVNIVGFRVTGKFEIIGLYM